MIVNEIIIKPVIKERTLNQVIGYVPVATDLAGNSFRFPKKYQNPSPLKINHFIFEIKSNLQLPCYDGTLFTYLKERSLPIQKRQHLLPK